MLRAAQLLCFLTLVACGVDEVGIDPPDDSLHNPMALASHPDGRYLYIANAIFDRKYNAGTVMVYDSFERHLLPEATVRVGLFAGDMVIGRPASGEGEVLAFLSTRDDDRIVRLSIKAEESGQGHLRCGGSSCGGAWVTDRTTDADLAGDPFGLSYDGQHLYLSHLERGLVSSWSVTGDQAPIYGCAFNLEGGVSNIAQHPLLGWVYVTDRGGQRIRVLENSALSQGSGLLGDACSLSLRQNILVDPYSERGHTRGLNFSADGSLLYVASSSDDSLRIYDVSINAEGLPRNRLLAIIPVGSAPNRVKVAGLRPGEHRAASQLLQGEADRLLDEKGEGLIYVSVFNDDRVLVIDPAIQAVIERIDVGTGPHDIAILPDGAGQLRGYVSNFRDHSLAVLDLEPGSPSRFQLLATIL